MLNYFFFLFLFSFFFETHPVDTSLHTYSNTDTVKKTKTLRRLSTQSEPPLTHTITHLGLTWLRGMFSLSAMSSTVSLPSEMMPTPLAMALAVIGWSPVTMITWPETESPINNRRHYHIKPHCISSVCHVSQYAWATVHYGLLGSMSHVV